MQRVGSVEKNAWREKGLKACSKNLLITALDLY